MQEINQDVVIVKGEIRGLQQQKSIIEGKCEALEEKLETILETFK